MRFLALLLFIPLLAGCVESNYEPFTPSTATEPTTQAPPAQSMDADPPALVNATDPVPIGETVRFLIIGDAGSGSDDQFRVGATMRSVCADRGCDFVMTTGDNIYDAGGFTEYDPQFDNKFELPYEGFKNDNGDDMPFYLSLGNHDNFFGGFSQLVGESQVRYHDREDKPSNMWNMPDRYYSQRFGDVLEIFAIDTDSIYKDDPTVDVTPEQHQAWLREALDASDATWKIAFGHYNYVSNGNYGDGKADFKAAIEDSLCDRAHFYAWGHDHDLQWVKPVDTCGRTEFIGSSAASKSRSLDDEWEFEAYAGFGDVLGFAWIEMVGETMTLQFIDVEENVLFERSTTLTALGF